MYPYIDQLQLIRHEQSVLFGEAAQQTGIFFATAKGAFSEKVQKQLISDGLQKGWVLHSFYRYGTTYVITMTQGDRILDIRLNNNAFGVDAVYSVTLKQAQVQSPRPGAAAVAPVTLPSISVSPSSSESGANAASVLSNATASGTDQIKADK
jgi:hypothetical protein